MSGFGNGDDDVNNARREFLLRTLAAGTLLGSAGWTARALSEELKRGTGRLPEGKSIYEMRGEVMVNGERATSGTLIGPSDTIRTGSNSYLIAAVAGNAFMIRENSSLELGGDNDTIRTLRLAAGRMLGLFARKPKGDPVRFRTNTVTIGIRGTAVYTEAYADRTYVCTCFGSTELIAASDPTATEQIKSKHHDAPRWILADPEKGRYILPAPMINHTDEELKTLEVMMGSTGSYGKSDPLYERPRREY